MADEKNGASFVCNIVHARHAFLLKRGVANREDFVNEEYFGLKVGSNRKCQSHVHAAGISLDGRVEEAFDAGKIDDLVKLAADLRTPHAKDASVQVYVFAACQLRMEAGADFQKTSNTTIEKDLTLCRFGDAAEYL